MRNDIPNMAEELFALGEAFSEQRVVLAQDIGQAAEKHFAENIIQGGNPTFKPLSASRIRQRQGSEEPVLIWTGHGLDTVANSAQPPEVSDSLIVIPFEAEDYMKYHNEGDGNPKREFAGDDVDEIVNEKIEEFLIKL